MLRAKKQANLSISAEALFCAQSCSGSDLRSTFSCFVIHHIIADGWSMNLLFHEMGELYAGFATGNQPPLPKLNLQYADYARWQRNFMTSDFLAGELDYWKNKLRGAETVLQLPTDYTRPAAHSGRGKSLHFDLSQETNKSLKTLAQSENATAFMALLAVFQVLLEGIRCRRTSWSALRQQEGMTLNLKI